MCGARKRERQVCVKLNWPRNEEGRAVQIFAGAKDGRSRYYSPVISRADSLYRFTIYVFRIVVAAELHCNDHKRVVAVVVVAAAVATRVIGIYISGLAER